MSSNVPTVRQFSWTAILPQLTTIAVFSVLAHFIGLDEYLGISGVFANIMYGAIGQVILWIIIRNTFAKFHKLGMDLVKQEIMKTLFLFLPTVTKCLLSIHGLTNTDTFSAAVQK